MAKATRGSHCTRWKRVGGKKRCATFGKRGKKSRGMSGAISECKRYKTITIKHGKHRGERVMRCALYHQGPGYPSVEYRTSAGVRKPDSVQRLSEREARAREARIKKNINRYRPSAM
jgi:hypothetical protein